MGAGQFDDRVPVLSGFLARGRVAGRLHLAPTCSIRGSQGVLFPERRRGRTPQRRGTGTGPSQHRPHRRMPPGSARIHGLRRPGVVGSAVPPGPTGVLRSTRPAPLVRGARSVTGEPAHVRDHRADRGRRDRLPTDRTTGDDLPLLGPEPAVAVGLVVRQRLRPAGNRGGDRVDQIQVVGSQGSTPPGRLRLAHHRQRAAPARLPDQRARPLPR